MSEDGPHDVPMGDWPDVELIPGALEAVEALRGFTLCVATNASISTRPDIERALARVGLLAHFSHIFCFTELGVRKETPQFWQAVQGTLGLAAEHIAMVGDTLEPDVLAPMRAGLFSVWFNPTLQAHPAGVRAVARLPDFSAMVRNAA
jgi:HAD superfamily hydrolase (TIGR01509 family)